MQSGGNKAMSFGKSRAKLSTNHQKKVTFKDVAGVEEAKEELQEIIECGASQLSVCSPPSVLATQPLLPQPRCRTTARLSTH